MPRCICLVKQGQSTRRCRKNALQGKVTCNVHSDFCVVPEKQKRSNEQPIFVLLSEPRNMFTHTVLPQVSAIANYVDVADNGLIISSNSNTRTVSRITTQ